jgi:hypothetical protein
VTISRQIAAVSTRSLPACRSSPLQLALDPQASPDGALRPPVYLATQCNHARISFTSQELSKALKPGLEPASGFLVSEARDLACSGRLGPWAQSSTSLRSSETMCLLSNCMLFDILTVTDSRPFLSISNRETCLMLQIQQRLDQRQFSSLSAIAQSAVPGDADRGSPLGLKPDPTDSSALSDAEKPRPFHFN